MIAGLILAAGESSRMGRDKALLPYRGRTFLEVILQTLRNANLERIAVVLGHHAEEIRQVVNLEGVEVVVNQDYKRGQTSSLQAGLRVISPKSSVAAASPPSQVTAKGGDGDIAATAVVLCLVDHPAVATDTVRKLLSSFEEFRPPVVIPAHQGRRGHPVVISSTLFAELLGLAPEEGANTIIRKYRPQTAFVEVDDPGILLDVDDPDSLARLGKL